MASTIINCDPVVPSYGNGPKFALGIVKGRQFTLDASGAVYLDMDYKRDMFTGYASMQLIMTSGAVTIQLQSDNTGDYANFMIGYDTTGTAHPALCTAQTASKFFESIDVPAALRNRWKISEAAGTPAAASGTIYLFLSQGV